MESHKGAISQTLAKLEKRGLILRKKKDGNARTVHLYVTDKGKELSEAHKNFDIEHMTSLL